MQPPDPPVLHLLHALLRTRAPPFVRGMRTEQGRVKRAQWEALEKQLRHVQHFAAGSVQRAPAEQHRLLHDLRACVVDAVQYLVHGAPVLEDVAVAQQIRVWSSPQSARVAIIQEAVALAHSRRDAPLTHGNPPLVILISERSQHAPSPNTSNPYEPHQAQPESQRRNFLDAWSAACYGAGEVLTILAESADKVRQSAEQVFEGLSQSDITPVLVVIHASHDSNITSDITSLKRLCASQNARLCVEGPALALLAQPNRPSDPEECAAVADVLLLDPASWFGFRMCAFVTWHKLHKAPVLREFKDHYSRLLVNAGMLRDQDETHGLATAPVLNLWTVLSRLGLENIRDSIDAVTFLAESFVNSFRDSPNVVTAYEGIGCVVRISYALSREDRLLPKEKTQQHVSLVNKVLFASLREESQALCVQQSMTPDGTCLQFAPARLLSSGTLWIPPVDMVEEYSKKLQDTVDKYESCRAGSVAFRSCVAKCREVEFVEDVKDQPELHLSFGAFRIVPVEMGHTWNQNESTIEIVEGLTRLVAKELTESPHDISVPKYVVQQETEKARALAEQFSRNTASLRPKFLSRALHRRWPFPHGYSTGGPLPFDVFLHSDSNTKFHEFMSIEPRVKCKPVDAVNQAATASDLMITCVAKVMGLWRAGEITLPLEDDDRNETISDSAENPEQDAENTRGLVTAEEPSIENRFLDEAPGNHNTDQTQAVHESEVSSGTRNSSEEDGDVSSQGYDVEADSSSKPESDPSLSSHDLELEISTNAQTILDDLTTIAKPEAKKHEDRIKDFLSVSTIEKSPGGIRTDEEAVPSYYILPTAAKDPHQASSAGASTTAEPAESGSTGEAVPVIQAAAGSGWFGYWAGKESSKRHDDDDDDESNSSATSGESSGGDEYESENEGSCGSEDDEETPESGSSSSEETHDDRGSNDSGDETSEDTDRNDDEESEDSVREASSSEATDELHTRTGRKKVENSSVTPSRTSRLFSWIRGGNTQSEVRKSKQNQKSLSTEANDSEITSTSSHSDLEEEETHLVSSSDEEEDASPRRRIQSSSSDHEDEAGNSAEFERGSMAETESAGSESDSSRSDRETRVVERSRREPEARSYGFKWLGWTGESSKSTSSRVKRRSAEQDSDLDSSAENETTSQESNVTERSSRESSKQAQLDYESNSEDESSEGTYDSNEANRPSLEDETSHSSDSSQDGREKELPETQRRITESSSAESGSMSDGHRSSNSSNQGTRSFFDWALPSWATTPPKPRDAKAPIRGVNFHLRRASLQSSTDDESYESYESERQAIKGRTRTTSARGKWCERNVSSSAGNRYRRRRR